MSSVAITAMKVRVVASATDASTSITTSPFWAGIEGLSWVNEKASCLCFISIIYHTNALKSRDNVAHRSNSYSHLNSDNMARLLLRLSLISRGAPRGVFVKYFFATSAR